MKTKDGKTAKLNFRVKPMLDEQITKRANELEMNVSEYLTLLIIYDLRFRDATAHIKQLVKNHSVGHHIIPGNKKHDAEMKSYWRAEQLKTLSRELN